MATARKDFRGRVLRKGEVQHASDKRYHLRHTFCTRLCENETNLKVIQSVMGHKDIQTTMDVYAEATEQKKQESFERLAAKLDIF